MGKGAGQGSVDERKQHPILLLPVVKKSTDVASIAEPPSKSASRSGRISGSSFRLPLFQKAHQPCFSHSKITEKSKSLRIALRLLRNVDNSRLV
jgi:hypothetical protein